MKNEGIVALVIFIFLFFLLYLGNYLCCRRHLQKSASQKQKIKSLCPSKSEITSSHSLAPGNFQTKDGADEKKFMNHILEHFGKLSQLHKEGSLADEEFFKFKEQLIK